MLKKMCFILVLIFASCNLVKAEYVHKSMLPCFYSDLSIEDKKEVDKDNEKIKNSPIETFKRNEEGYILPKQGSCNGAICPNGYKLDFYGFGGLTRCVEDKIEVEEQQKAQENSVKEEQNGNVRKKLLKEVGIVALNILLNN